MKGTTARPRLRALGWAAGPALLLVSLLPRLYYVATNALSYDETHTLTFGALSAAGYVTPSDAVPVPVQPDAALNTIRLFIGPIPAVILLTSLVIAYYYPITRAKHARIVAVLDRRRKHRARLAAAPA